MSHIIQPGGGGGMMRMRYTAQRNHGLIATSKRMMAEGMTLRAATSELCVSAANLSKWASQGMGEIDRLDKILRSKKKAALIGPTSQLKAIKDGLLRYIFEKREQVIEMKVITVVLRASFMLPEFHEKSFTARCSCVKHFLHAHSFSYRMGTHTAQQPPVEVENEAFDFMRFVRIIVSGDNHDRRFIINMDQAPVYFSMSSKRTLEVIGEKHPHSHVDE
jgi:hypothetical protein